MASLAVIILTYNEEVNIEKCIAGAKLVTEEIIIIDSGSTDNTVSIAERLGVKVHTRKMDSFAAQRNFGWDKTEADYLFFLDADEFITPELAEAVKEAIGKNKQEVYIIKRMNIAFGRIGRYGVLRPDFTPRIFPKGSAVWQGKVHEEAVHRLPTSKLKGFVWHETQRTFEQYLGKMNKYSSFGADKNIEKGKLGYSLVDIALKPLFSFFKMYIIRQGFREGIMGFALSANYAIYTMNKYVKQHLKQGDI